MKKSLKICLIILVIFCLLVIAFFVRNKIIINKIYNLQEKTLSRIENSSNFLYERESINNNTKNVKTQLYCKDGVLKSITYLQGELYDTDYLDTKETNNQNQKDKFMEEIKNVAFVFNNNIKISICQYIKSEGNYYIISVPKFEPANDDYYVNKETGMVEKWKTDGEIWTLKITENVVTDTDMEKQEDI